MKKKKKKKEKKWKWKPCISVKSQEGYYITLYIYIYIYTYINIYICMYTYIYINLCINVTGLEIFIWASISSKSIQEKIILRNIELKQMTANNRMELLYVKEATIYFSAQCQTQSCFETVQTVWIPTCNKVSV